MNAIPSLSIDERKRLRVNDIVPDGPVIRVTPIEQARVSDIPLEFLDVIKSAKASGANVTLVTCRRIGMPESSDKSHLQHFLVSAAANINAIGVTF
ncbi:MAG: hypothetical protein KGQ41_03780 [Alphaproteobacteria bacterium]|nr:hypothetical protein [Alphaproteobacteria bacterium]